MNGVVVTLEHTRDELERQGHEVLMITPEGRRTIPCPTYPEIRLMLFGRRQVYRELDTFKPDCVHIATEGPIGLAARRYCLRRKLPFTTAYHTQFPEFVRARAPIPVSWTAALLRWFHKPADCVMVPTEAIRKQLEDRRFRNVVIWERGVRTDIFNPDDAVQYDCPKPIWIYMGRVAVEKSIDDFLDLELEGSKIVIGDGPDRQRLERKYPGTRFLGYMFGRELARHVAGGDVFVFPSRTDTFGIVLLEAMACGLPVAAYPVTGPIDVVRHGETGVLDDDLSLASREALKLGSEAPREFAANRSWARCTEQFVSHITPGPARVDRLGLDATIENAQEPGREARQEVN